MGVREDIYSIVDSQLQTERDDRVKAEVAARLVEAEAHVASAEDTLAELRAMDEQFAATTAEG